MSTRATIYIHKIGVKTPTGGVMLKLYQHTDGYVEGLGIALVRGFQEYRGLWHLDKCIKKANYCHQNKFEITHGNHGDTEFSYHIYQNKSGSKLKITYQEGFGDEDILKQEEKELMRVEKGRDKYGCDTWSIWWLSSLSRGIEDEILIDIKQRIEGRYEERFYSDLMFYKRFGVHKIDDFRLKVNEEINAYKQLRANEEIEIGKKYELEDEFLIRIRDKIKEQVEIEKKIYFSF